MATLVRIIASRLGAGRDERGQGLAEYALILALIAVVAIVALTFLGTSISDILNDVGGCLADPAAC
ncbi:MAG TPA: Flp family type IVb pilin [Candidatus Limnocylindria bacterium]|nr:Flp family type IVb pilin [Candidatus Limnocylindria bacterium]